MSTRCFATLFWVFASMVAAAGHVRNMRGALPHSQGAQGVSAAPAPAPTMPAETINTELKNMNYYDMTKKWKDPFSGEENDSSSGNPNDWMMEMGKDAPKKGKKTAEEKSQGSEKEAAPVDPIGEMLGDAPAKQTDGPEAKGPIDDSPTGGDPEAEGPIDDAPADGNPESGSGDSDAPNPLEGVVNLGALPWPAKGSLLQVDAQQDLARQVAKQLSRAGSITLQNAMRTAIEAAVKDAIGCDAAGAAPGPAPAPAPVSFQEPPAPRAPLPPRGMLPATVALASLPPWGNGPPPTAQMLPSPQAPAPAFAPRFMGASAGPGAAPGPAAGPAPGPAAPCPMPKVHVAFGPGRKMKKKHLLNAPAIHATTLITVTLYERPGNSLADLQGVQAKLTQKLATGELKEKLAVAIHGVTGVKPKLAAIKVKSTIVKLWDFQKCGGHMSQIVKSFTIHYTKRQVPLALYNECTNFVTKMSFSHDYVLDHRDAARCRKATRKFAQRWKLGEAKNPQTFEPMCQRFCEAKFGDDAPQCQFQ